MNKAIESSGIWKNFGDTQALKDISFDVSEGEIFGFIGPDGAGKTTLFRIITTLLLPDKGSMTILGLDSTKGYKKLRENIGYMPGRFSLYLDLKVEENLKFYASVFGTTVEENYELIRDIYSHIEPFKTRLAGKLSGGMKQKLALSCALIHRPRLLVLDEPTASLDPGATAEIERVIASIAAEGTRIVMTTHNLGQARRLADEIVFIHAGKAVERSASDRFFEQPVSNEARLFLQGELPWK